MSANLLLLFSLLVSISSFAMGPMAKKAGAKEGVWEELSRKHKEDWNQKKLSEELFLENSEFLKREDTDIYPYRVTSTKNHQMKVINSGIASLYARVDMIRRAQKTLDLEFFIFNVDRSGRIILKELKKAVERGVKVRILVDQFLSVFALNKYYAEELKKNGIEIKYYNNAPFYKLSSIQFRNHRKFMIMDGKLEKQEAITGGRNIGDEYFDLSEKFNFFDRDVWVEGEIINAMTDSFNNYWKDSITSKAYKVVDPVKKKSDDFLPYHLKKVGHEENVKAAKKVFLANKEDDKILQFVLTYGMEVFHSLDSQVCDNVAFASDREGATFFERIKSKKYKNQYRLLRKEITKWLRVKVKDKILLDSPYLLSTRRNSHFMRSMIDRKVDVRIFTNSLASTDAEPISAIFHEEVKEFTPFKNFNVYMYKGKYNDEIDLYSDKIKNTMWGTHSKTLVFNDDSFMIGSFNIDNRSSFYNTESALFCSGSALLTSDIVKSIEKRMEDSFHLDENGKPDDGSSLTEGAGTLKKILYYMLKIPAPLFKFLM